MNEETKNIGLEEAKENVPLVEVNAPKIASPTVSSVPSEEAPSNDGIKEIHPYEGGMPITISLDDVTVYEDKDIRAGNYADVYFTVKEEGTNSPFSNLSFKIMKKGESFWGQENPDELILSGTTDQDGFIACRFSMPSSGMLNSGKYYIIFPSLNVSFPIINTSLNGSPLSHRRYNTYRFDFNGSDFSSARPTRYNIVIGQNFYLYYFIGNDSVKLGTKSEFHTLPDRVSLGYKDTEGKFIPLRNITYERMVETNGDHVYGYRYNFKNSGHKNFDDLYLKIGRGGVLNYDGVCHVYTMHKMVSMKRNDPRGCFCFRADFLPNEFNRYNISIEEKLLDPISGSEYRYLTDGSASPDKFIQMNINQGGTISVKEDPIFTLPEKKFMYCEESQTQTMRSDGAPDNHSFNQINDGNRICELGCLLTRQISKADMPETTKGLRFNGNIDMVFTESRSSTGKVDMHFAIYPAKWGSAWQPGTSPGPGAGVWRDNIFFNTKIAHYHFLFSGPAIDDFHQYVSLEDFTNHDPMPMPPDADCFVFVLDNDYVSDIPSHLEISWRYKQSSEEGRDGINEFPLVIGGGTPGGGYEPKIIPQNGEILMDTLSHPITIDNVKITIPSRLNDFFKVSDKQNISGELYTIEPLYVGSSGRIDRIADPFDISDNSFYRKPLTFTIEPKNPDKILNDAEYKALVLEASPIDPYYCPNLAKTKKRIHKSSSFNDEAYCVPAKYAGINRKDSGNMWFFGLETSLSEADENFQIPICKNSLGEYIWQPSSKSDCNLAMSPNGKYYKSDGLLETYSKIGIPLDEITIYHSLEDRNYFLQYIEIKNINSGDVFSAFLSEYKNEDWEGRPVFDIELNNIYSIDKIIEVPIAVSN